MNNDSPTFSLVGGARCGATPHTFNSDCLAVLPALPPASFDAVIADPPYGTTKNAWDRPIDPARLFPLLWRVAKPAAPVILFCQFPFGADLMAAARAEFRYDLVWEKSVPVGFLNANRRPLSAHENILVFARRPPAYFPQFAPGEPYRKFRADSAKKTYGAFRGEMENNSGTRYPRSVLYFPRDPDNGKHPTQKPISLMKFLCRSFVPPGGSILDFCMGSGSTGAAALECGYSFTGIEKDPDIYHSALARLSAAASSWASSLFSIGLLA